MPAIKALISVQGDEEEKEKRMKELLHNSREILCKLATTWNENSMEEGVKMNVVLRYQMENERKEPPKELEQNCKKTHSGIIQLV